MVSSIIKLTGHNSQLFWGVFNRKPSSALVRTETLFTFCWSQCGVSLLLASTMLSGNTSWGNIKCRRKSELQGLSRSCRLLSQTQSSASFLLSVLSPWESCWGTVPVSCDCWDCDSAEPEKTRRDLYPLSWCVSEECPNFPCWDTHYPSTKPSCIYRTHNIVIMANTYCHHTQAPQAWSES